MTANHLRTTGRLPKTRLLLPVFLLLPGCFFAQATDSTIVPAAPGTAASLQADTVRAAGLPVSPDRRHKTFHLGDRSLKPAEFLALCRTACDSTLQSQLTRYDRYASCQKKLGFAMMETNFGSIALYGGALFTLNAHGNTAIALACAGLACTLSLPVLGTCAGVAAHKKKNLLFKDIPESYNRCVARDKQEKNKP